VQNVWLYADSPRIDFDTVIDWHEHHQIMKAAFPVDVNAASATYEIQFGHVSRPTHENTSWDQAKFEVYGHKWVDVAENGYGVSLLNDCKYGYSAEGSTLKLTILKCGTDPNPDADQGQHILTYSLLPHEGDFREAGIIREAYCLNQPLEAVVKPGAEGGSSAGQVLPAEFSLASCSRENVILETIKKAEVDEGMILRAYEAFNRRTNAVISVAEGFSRAYLCDLMENILEELPFDGKRVALQLTGFEIVTLKFVR
jgi:alpha-mannosidase